tara:strand:+ start:694 stop:951 length:258 start_codon:yes stop_codon:yes gene_type:complete
MSAAQGQVVLDDIPNPFSSGLVFENGCQDKLNLPGILPEKENINLLKRTLLDLLKAAVYNGNDDEEKKWFYAYQTVTKYFQEIQY